MTSRFFVFAEFEEVPSSACRSLAAEQAERVPGSRLLAWVARHLAFSQASALPGQGGASALGHGCEARSMIIEASQRCRPLPTPATRETTALLRSLHWLGETAMVFRCGSFNLWRGGAFRGFIPQGGSPKWRDSASGLSLDPSAVSKVDVLDDGGAGQLDLHVPDAGACVSILCSSRGSFRSLVWEVFGCVRETGKRCLGGSATGDGLWLDESLDPAPGSLSGSDGSRALSKASFGIDLEDGLVRLRFASRALDLDLSAALRLVDRDGSMLRLADPEANTVVYLRSPASALPRGARRPSRRPSWRFPRPFAPQTHAAGCRLFENCPADREPIEESRFSPPLSAQCHESSIHLRIRLPLRFRPGPA